MKCAFTSVSLLLIPILALVLVPVRTAQAQFDYGGGMDTAARSAGALVGMVDFSFNPAKVPDAAFRLSDPAIGVYYARQGFMGQLARSSGTDARGRDLTLVEGSVDAWADVRPFDRTPRTRLDVFFPIGLYGNYRKVTLQEGEIEGTVFDVSVLALGIGAGLGIRLGESRLLVQSRPFIGLASRSFSTETGSSTGYMVNARWVFPDIRSGVGAYAGWGYRWQRWLLDASAIMTEGGSQHIAYRGSMHAMLVGLTF